MGNISTEKVEWLQQGRAVSSITVLLALNLSELDFDLDKTVSDGELDPVLMDGVLVVLVVWFMTLTCSVLTTPKMIHRYRWRSPINSA